jgi:hypothetical protein
MSTKVQRSIFLLFWSGKVCKQTSWYCQHCLITGVVDTSKKFIGGVIDTGEEFFVSATLTPAKNFRLFGNFLPVSTTPGNTFISGINDTRSLKIRDQD